MTFDQTAPVFVFLDENIAGSHLAIAEYFIKNFSAALAKYDLFFFPFPKKHKGKKDFQVVLYLQEAVWRWPLIKNLLLNGSAPIAVFLTLDLNFIEDARFGFQRWDREWSKHQPEITLTDEQILFWDNQRRLSLTVTVLCTPCGVNEQYQKLIQKISETLHTFLNCTILSHP